MTRISTIQNSFASGEIDPRLIGQTDIKSYSQGLKRMRNCARLSTGGVERRYGTFDLAAINARARLAKFEFSDEQRYILAFSDDTVQMFSMNGALLQTMTGAPWDEPMSFGLDYSQLGDIMVITHQSFWPKVITRTGSTSFTLTDFAFDADSSGNKVFQPYFKFEAASTTLTPSGTTGSINLVASSGIFTSDWVGLRLRIQGVEVLITAYTNATTIVATVKGTLKVKLDLDPLKTTNGSGVVEVTHVYHGYANGASITFMGINNVAGLTSGNLNGPHVITVLDEHHYVYAATSGTATASEDGGGTNVEVSAAGQGIRDWLEPVVSIIRGYPGACAFHEGRLWLGGTSQFPDGYWSSKSLEYFNFDVGIGNDNDSIQGAVGTEDISRIRHLVSNGELQVLTPVRELAFITPEGAAVTPLNQRVKSQSVAGCSYVQPIVFDAATLFVQENGLSISELSFSTQQGGYLAVPVSTLAGHLVVDPVSAASSPGVVSHAEQYAFFVNVDGTCAVFHSLRIENLAGWGLWTLGAGEFVSVAAAGPYVFFCVEVRGSFRLYRLSTEPIISLDGAVYVTGVPSKTWTLPANVRSRTVAIVSDFGYHGEMFVPSTGIITLDVMVTQVVAGDKYVFEMESLPPLIDLPSGTRTRFVKRLVRTALELYDAHAITVDGQRIHTLRAGEDWEGALNPITGAREIRHLGFSRSPTVTVSQIEPLPATVLAWTQEVKV